MYSDAEADLKQRKSTYLLMSPECIDRLHIKRSTPKSEREDFYLPLHISVSM